tara:strand:+ start:274 stop:1407 length:1134 start_codon:yes stop_codon:yes gene_type:complete
MSESINITYDSIEFKDISDNILNSIVCDASGNLDISGGTLITQNISATDISCVNLTGNADSVTNGVYTTDTGTVTNDMLSGSIANDKLANFSVSFGGVSLDLGDNDATPAFDLTDATNYPASSLSGSISNSQLAGSITNDKIDSADAWNAKAGPHGSSSKDFNCRHLFPSGEIKKTNSWTIGDSVTMTGLTGGNNNSSTDQDYLFVLQHDDGNQMRFDKDTFSLYENNGGSLDRRIIMWLGSGNIGSTGNFYGSDDRLKHNEIFISDSLSVINKLKPLNYYKTLDFYEHNKVFASDEIPDDAIYESGFIAQDVRQIPELSHLVKGEETDADGNKSALFMNYTNLHAYSVKAIQELHALVLEQKQQILDLSAQVAALS